MSVIIEKLDTSDWKEYLSLRYQLGEYNGSIDEDEFICKYIDIQKQGGYIFVIKKDNSIIATGKLLIELKFFDSVAHIEDVVVDIKHRNQGYGKMIVNFLLNQATSYKTILDCREDLRDFYKKQGMTSNGISMVKFNKKKTL
jgi:predicted GNAT family N-acyltransferase